MTIAASSMYDLRVKIPFYGKPAGFNKLDDNRQAGDSPLVLNIGKIAVIYVDNLRQGAAGQAPCFPGRFHVLAKTFKARAIFDFCHIASPTYILYFIDCPWNDAICSFLKLYISYFCELIRIRKCQYRLTSMWHYVFDLHCAFMCRHNLLNNQKPQSMPQVQTLIYTFHVVRLFF